MADNPGLGRRIRGTAQLLGIPLQHSEEGRYTLKCTGTLKMYPADVHDLTWRESTTMAWTITLAIGRANPPNSHLNGRGGVKGGNEHVPCAMSMRLSTYSRKQY